jgi:hypothetical protein
VEVVEKLLGSGEAVVILGGSGGGE